MSQEPAAIPNQQMKTIILIIMTAPAMSFANAVNTCVHTGKEGRAHGKRSTEEGDATTGAPKIKVMILIIINSSSDVICQCGEYLCTHRKRRPSSRQENAGGGRLCRRSPPQFQIEQKS